MKKYKIQEATPRQENLISENNSLMRSNYDYEKFMIDEHGYERKVLIGSIEDRTKIHSFNSVCKINKETNTIYIATCYNYCGSAKWLSQLYM